MTQPMEVQGIRIACPEGWTDRSMLVLTRPGPSGVDANLVVTRETPDGAASPDGASDMSQRIEAHVDAQVAGWRRLEGFREVARRHATPADPIAEVHIAWTAGEQPLAQQVTYAPADDATIVVAAATMAQTDVDAFAPQFRALLDGLRLV